MRSDWWAFGAGLVAAGVLGCSSQGILGSGGGAGEASEQDGEGQSVDAGSNSLEDAGDSEQLDDGSGASAPAKDDDDPGQPTTASGGSGNDSTDGAGGVYLSEDFLRELSPGSVGAGGYSGIPDGCEQRLGEFEPVQVWTGYAENYDYSLSDRIELRFLALSAGDVRGEAVFGDGPWDDGYTVPADLDEIMNSFGVSPMDTGFAYTILDGQLDGNRLRFRVDMSEPWCAWCAEFEPLEVRAGEYSCAPTTLGGSQGPDGCVVRAEDTEAEVPWNCMSLFACGFESQQCGCTEAGCSAVGLTDPARSMNGVRFDISIDSATLARGSMDRFGVRFSIAVPGAGGTAGS